MLEGPARERERDAEGWGIRIKYWHLLCGWSGHSPPASHYPSTMRIGEGWTADTMKRGRWKSRDENKKNWWVLVGVSELTGSTWRTWAWRLCYRLSAIIASHAARRSLSFRDRSLYAILGLTEQLARTRNWSVCICVDERHANFARADFITRPSQHYSRLISPHNPFQIRSLLQRILQSSHTSKI